MHEALELLRDLLGAHVVCRRKFVGVFPLGLVRFAPRAPAQQDGSQKEGLRKVVFQKLELYLSQCSNGESANNIGARASVTILAYSVLFLFLCADCKYPTKVLHGYEIEYLYRTLSIRQV